MTVKLIIRPPIEIEVDGYKCGDGCPQFYQDQWSDRCLFARVDLYSGSNGVDAPTRCRACLDAESEGEYPAPEED